MTDDAWTQYIKDIKKKIKHYKKPKIAKSVHQPMLINDLACAPKILLNKLKIPILSPKISHKRLSKQKVDVTVDLHGLTQTEAFLALKNCLEEAYLNNAKHVLIITGNGPLDKPGVIKLVLPRWLQYTELNKYILSYTKADDHLGGEGAMMVTLKRIKL